MEMSDRAATTLDRERARRWRDPALGSVEFLSATYFTHSYAPHSHEEYAIGVIEDGAEAFDYRGAMHTATPGSVVLLMPDEIHTGHAAPGARGWQYRMLYPGTELVRAASGGAGDTVFFPTPVIDDPELASGILAFHRAAESGASLVARESGLLSILSAAIRRHARGTSTDHRTRNDHAAARLIREYIDANYTRNLSLAELAAVARLSPFHLNRIFRAAIGLPPHRYLEQVRVRRARALLGGDRSLSWIALEAGFVDQPHFTRHFKRHLGVTPGEYRCAIRSR